MDQTYRLILKAAIACLLISLSPALEAFNGTAHVNELEPDVWHGISLKDVPQLQTGCIDSQGQRVADGEKYVPDSNDPCTQCTCDMTFPVMCHSVACSPPQNCEPLDNTCCEYVCNGTRPVEEAPDDGESITNLSLRLIASTVTSFLVLALLLFLVHRVRQRRLLLSMRRFEERAQQVHSEDTDSEHYIPEVFMSVECPPYTDPPPPYSPPKPPQILPGEQPPPYEELNQNRDANGMVSHEDTNQGTLTGSQGEGNQEYRLDTVHSLGEENASQGRVLQDTSCYPECCERVGSHLPRAVESAQLELQAVAHRPPRAADNCMELRESRDQGASSRCFVDYSIPNFLGCAMARVQETGQPDRMATRRITGDMEPSASEHFETNTQQRRRQAAGRGSDYTNQTIPATTAFQRFSNLFKRHSWRAKNRRRLQNSSHGRGVSENQTSSRQTHYSTLPGAEYRSAPVSGIYAGFDLSACNFYPTTASPSTSSSNSSSGGEQITSHTTHPAHPLDNRFPHSNPNYSHCGVSPLHREQFQDDLRRHLPPICRQSENISSCLPGDVRENSARSLTYYEQVRHREIDPRRLSSAPRDLVKGPRDLASLRDSGLRDQAQGHCVNQQTVHSSTAQTQSIAADPQRSLASVICSNLPLAAAAHINKPCISSSLYDPLRSTCGSRNNNLANEISTHQPLDLTKDTSASSASHEEQVPSACSDSHILAADDNLDVCRSHQPEGRVTKPGSSAQFCGADAHIEPSLIRRSHSDTSEGSLFSVCSETGEQKLKSNWLAGMNGKADGEASVLPADCPYPQHHSFVLGKGSLPVSKHSTVAPCSGGIGSNDNGGGSHRKHSTPASQSGLDGVQLGAQRDSVNLTDQPTQMKKSFTGENGKADGLHDSSDVNYNLNISPLIQKRLVSKDLLPVVGEERMVMSVNLPPLDTRPCSFSSNSMDQPVQKTSDQIPFHFEEAAASASARITTGRPEDVSKKRHKKSSAGGSFSPIAVHHGGAKQKLSSSNKEKPEASAKASATDSKSDKSSSKRKIQQELFHAIYPQFDVNSDSQLMVRSAGEPSTVFGNADVYRGSAHSNLQGPIVDNALTKDGLDSGMNDLNQPPRKLTGGWDTGGYRDDVGTTSLSSHYPGTNQAVVQQLRRRSGQYPQHQQQHHRRQASAGTSDTARVGGRVVSPLRRKPRPKSLAAPREMDPTCVKNVTPPSGTPIKPATDVCLNSRGRARSGFGHDMNLDSEYGMADFHVDSINSSSQSKGSVSYAAAVGAALPLKQALKAGAGRSVPGGGAVEAAGGPQPNTNSKSGPCKDLSFVGRSGTGKVRGSGGHRNKKRQSLPTFNPVLADPTDLSGQMPVAENENFPRSGLRKQLPGPPRFSGLARTLSEEDVREATSYV
ncbi:hypothetical protein EGW08_010816 [Elysia chlorotica]|uniref:VWFC domain-containing protein n=1 Tax=Elysia chlorotica TaxID=188477 RepID=A0A3S1A313_ELYCH|nr:hypothetical protein EGW08_010816 [Elysia chlorotica]